MTTILIHGASGQIDPAFKGTQSYDNAALRITPDPSTPEPDSPAAPTRVLFCLPPSVGRQPFVFSQAVLHASREGEGAQDPKVTLQSIKFGKSNWKVNRPCEPIVGEVEGVPKEFDYRARFDPPLGWNTAGTPLTLTYEIAGHGELCLQWLELGSRD